MIFEQELRPNRCYRPNNHGLEVLVLKGGLGVGL